MNSVNLLALHDGRRNISRSLLAVKHPYIEGLWFDGARDIISSERDFKRNQVAPVLTFHAISDSHIISNECTIISCGSAREGEGEHSLTGESMDVTVSYIWVLKCNTMVHKM